MRNVRLHRDAAAVPTENTKSPNHHCAHADDEYKLTLEKCSRRVRAVVFLTGGEPASIVRSK